MKPQNWSDERAKASPRRGRQSPKGTSTIDELIKDLETEQKMCEAMKDDRKRCPLDKTKSCIERINSCDCDIIQRHGKLKHLKETKPIFDEEISNLKSIHDKQMKSVLSDSEREIAELKNKLLIPNCEKCGSRMFIGGLGSTHWYYCKYCDLIKEIDKKSWETKGIVTIKDDVGSVEIKDVLRIIKESDWLKIKDGNNK